MSPKRKVSRPGSAQLAAAAASRIPAKDAGVVFTRRRRRRRIAVFLFALGPLIAALHLVEHVGFVRFFNPGLQDVLIGYPTAILLLVLGGILWG